MNQICNRRIGRYEEWVRRHPVLNAVTQAVTMLVIGLVFATIFVGVIEEALR